MSDSVQPHRRQPTRLLCPRNFPGKYIGVGCHFLLQYRKVESENWKGSCSVVSNPQRPHGLQPSRLLHPWDFPGKSTGVGCHCLLRDLIYYFLIYRLGNWGEENSNDVTKRYHHLVSSRMKTKSRFSHYKICLHQQAASSHSYTFFCGCCLSFPVTIPHIINDTNAGGVSYCGWEVKKMVNADG